MSSLTAQRSEFSQVGYFRIYARPPGGTRREITIFRGTPVVVGSATTTDPFSEQTASLELPQVTMWDNLGDGDLDWCVPDADIDIVFQPMGPYTFNWRWEGFIVNFDMSVGGSESSFSVSLKGALYGLDDYLAKPAYPKQPIPYEHLIRRAFDQSRNPCRLGPLMMTFPDGWDLRVPDNNDPEYLNFLKPWGVSTGQLWTGFTSRSTGSWEPVLTGHVQSLLTVMFADGGAQWTIRNNGYRRPELYLRQKPHSSDPDILEVDLGAPGVALQVSKDYTQRANVIYGNGQDDAGVAFNGMQVTPNGDATYFKPFAYSPVSYPRQGNPSFISDVKPKEVMVQFQQGVSEDTALKIAQAQLYRFNEPGITGTLTLTTDVRLASGQPFPRLLIQAGRTIRLKGMLGIREGLLVHVTAATVDFKALSVTLTIDSKYRDELTVEEVKARTKDALTPLRSLQVGKYSNTVQDLFMPWSYKEGSGCIPLGSKEFFMEKLPNDATFPYTDFTTTFPPSNPNYAHYYIKINPTNTTDSNKNWAAEARDGTAVMSIPIRMSQAGSIKLSQIAAYWGDGTVAPVRFHVSVYASDGVAADAMPKFPIDPDDPPGAVKFLKPDSVSVNYGVGQANPFFEGAWERIKPDGTEYDNDSMLPANGSELVIGWGNYYEPAGYYPGRFSKGASRTGQLSDTTAWTWDLTSRLALTNPRLTANEEYSGMLFVQIFCDDQGTQPVYFLGRFFRQEPGTS